MAGRGHHASARVFCQPRAQSGRHRGHGATRASGRSSREHSEFPEFERGAARCGSPARKFMRDTGARRAARRSSRSQSRRSSSRRQSAGVGIPREPGLHTLRSHECRRPPYDTRTDNLAEQADGQHGGRQPEHRPGCIADRDPLWRLTRFRVADLLPERAGCGRHDRCPHRDLRRDGAVRLVR